MIPRPSSQYHRRLTAARANHGLPGESSQLANTSRGSCPAITRARAAIRKDGRRGDEFGWVEVDDFFLPLAGGLVDYRLEEDRHPSQALLGPLLSPGAHECQGDGLRDGLRLLALHGAVEVGGRHVEVAACREQHLAHKAVVGAVLANAGADPAVISLGSLRPQVDRKLALDAEDVAPLHRPIVGELLSLQEAVDEDGSLVGIGAAKEVFDLLGDWYGADDIETGPADEDGVAAEAAGLDADLPQPIEDEPVDLALGNGHGLDLVGIGRRL